MPGYPSDLGFTPSVKAAQEARGSREIYARMEEHGGWRTTVDERLKGFIRARNSFFLATANAEGQPYIQHRGGPKGFLKVLDERTLGFADYAGNRQYITLGNLKDNPKAYIFLIDYENQRRMKLWGTARVVEDDPFLLEQLSDETYPARPERVILFTLGAYDINCPQHIPRMMAEVDFKEHIDLLQCRIEELEQENIRLRKELEGR
jgi:predicted pyridoxine 5'-phosphate oxidase superfamily flavin-nucleotide-binding protein